MSHTLHHWRWLARRFRLALLLCASGWVLLLAAVWLLPAIELREIFIVSHCALLLPAMVTTVAMMWQDAAVGTDAFWRTRPPRWRALWVSQLLFVIVCIAGPALLCWLVNGWLMQQTAAQWQYGALDLLIIICPLLTVAGIAAFTREWTGIAISLGVAALAITGGVLLLEQPAVWISGRRSVGNSRAIALTALTVPALTLALAWMIAMRRRSSATLAITTGLWLLAAPAIVWLVVRPQEEITVLTVRAASLDDSISRGEQRAGVNVLRGLPEGTEAVLTDDDLRKTTAGLMLTRQAGEVIRTALRSGVHWYSSQPDAKNPFEWILEDSSSLPQLRRLTRNRSGELVSTVPLVTLPLEEGASASAKGCRVHVHRVQYGRENLLVEVTLWLSAGMGSLMPPGGILPHEGSTPDGPLTVLHFPAIPMAVVMTRTQSKDTFRSWQCRTRDEVLLLSMPDGEFIRGVRFTPETMRGAQLLFFSRVLHGRFTVAPGGETVRLAP